LIVVLSAYKQIRAQSNGVLFDVDEDNFDRAFKLLRPVIQGGADMGHRLSEDELQRALDFCGNLFSPTSPDEHENAKALLASCGFSSDMSDATTEVVDKHLLDVNAPIINPKKIDHLSRTASQQLISNMCESNATDDLTSGPSGSESSAVDIKMVLDKINARRVIQSEHRYALNNFEEEPLGSDALVARLIRGQLGLVKVDRLITDPS
jgi:flavine halogenase